MENYNRMRNSLLNGTFVSRGVPAGKTVQIVAVDDIGAFAAMAFDRPKEFLGKTIELAGDELTEPQIVATFAKVIGRPVTLGSPQAAAGPFSEAERAAMARFFNGQGYDADIPALRKQYPQLKTLETFLRENGWENARPTPETTKAWG